MPRGLPRGSLLKLRVNIKPNWSASSRDVVSQSSKNVFAGRKSVRDRPIETGLTTAFPPITEVIHEGILIATLLIAAEAPPGISGTAITEAYTTAPISTMARTIFPLRTVMFFTIRRSTIARLARVRASIRSILPQSRVAITPFVTSTRSITM